MAQSMVFYNVHSVSDESGVKSFVIGIDQYVEMADSSGLGDAALPIA